MAKRSIRLTASATNDLQLIRQYSADVWGSTQASRYARSIPATFDSLGRFPELGTLVDPAVSSLRRHFVGKHVVYYRVFPDSVEILRVMHERAAVPEQFD